MTSFSNQTRGLALASIVHTAPDNLSFLVHGRVDNIDALGILHLDSTSPTRLKRLIRAILPGAIPDDIHLDDATRQKAIDAIREKLRRFLHEGRVSEEQL